MAGSVNKVILIGNLGFDPEIKYVDSGSAAGTFNIATTESFTKKNGEKVDTTEWHRIEVWEGLAKVAEKYLRKGSQVYIEGKIVTKTWTTKDGEKKSATNIRASNLTLLGAAQNGNGPRSTTTVSEEESDELPF